MKKYSLGVFFNIFTPDSSDWEDQFKFIHSLPHVEHIEVLLESPYISQKQILVLQQHLESYHVIIHAPFMDLALLSHHSTIVFASKQILTQAISIGEQLSCKLMTIHAERFPGYMNESEIPQKLIRIVHDLSADAPFPLAIENLTASGNTQKNFPISPEQLKALIPLLSSNEGLTIDTGHLLKGKYDVAKTIQNCAEKIMNIHLHDGSPTKNHLRLGDGDLDLSAFIRTLQKINYTSFLTIEVIGQPAIADSWNILLEEVDEF